MLSKVGVIVCGHYQSSLMQKLKELKLKESFQSKVISPPI